MVHRNHAPIFMPASAASHAAVSAATNAALTEPAMWTLPAELVVSGSHQSLRVPVFLSQPTTLPVKVLFAHCEMCVAFQTDPPTLPVPSPAVAKMRLLNTRWSWPPMMPTPTFD